MTESITWITPFDASISAVEITAPIHLGPAFQRDRDICALHGGGRQAFRQVGRHHFARHDVIGQHGDQLILVLGLQQVFHGASRQRGKGGIRRGKDGERAGALQRFDQTGGFNGSYQRGEGACTNGGVDDVLRVAFGESRGPTAWRRRWS